MLTPDFAFVQRVTLERWLRRGIKADEYSAPETMKCRVDFARKVVHGSNESAAIASGTVWLSAGTRIDVHDRLTFDGRTYTVLSCQPCFDIMGRENHVEVYIQ